MGDHSQATQSIVLTIALAIGVNIFTSLLSGGIALFFLLVAAVVAALILRPWSFAAGGFASGTRAMEWRTTVHFTAVMVLMGAIVGGISILPIFPAQTLSSGLAQSLASELFPESQLPTGVNGYEVLATGVLAGAALATLARGRRFTTAAQLILAGAAGCTAVLATARADFSAPALTYVGIVTAALAVTAVGLVLPSFWRVLKHLFGPTPDPAIERVEPTAPATVGSESSAENARPRRAR